MARWKTVLLRLLFGGLRGALYGLGIGFFFFLRLGFPKSAETAGYVSGLLCVAGIEFGITVEILRYLLSLGDEGSAVSRLRTRCRKDGSTQHSSNGSFR
jgi:hypothetical protein